VSRTLVICKPDAVERGYVGEIVGRLERKGLRLVAAELRALDADTLAKHYAEHVGKPFYQSLVEFMSRGPAFLAVVEGADDTYAMVRKLMGPTNPADAPPGTIRGDLGRDWGMAVQQNLVHGSDSPESAAREIGIWFPDL
jgi:nucleoside-diphosphate kinase